METQTNGAGPRTLGDLVAAEEQQFAQSAVSAEAGDALRTDMGAFDNDLLQAFSTSVVLVALHKALDVPLADIFKSAWGSALELQAYRNPEKHPPNETSWVKFGKHKLTSSHQPKIEVLLNGKRIGTLSFDVKLTLHVTGTKLRVRDARIWEAAGTSFKGDCGIAYKGFPFIKRDIAAVTLPGTITFDDGLPIPKLPVSVA